VGHTPYRSYVSAPSHQCVRDFIYLDKQLIAIHIKTDTTSTAGTPTTPIPDKTRYLHYDNLGSIDTITDGQGNIVERMSYAASLRQWQLQK
jgi:hypothetical protein